MPQCLVGGLQSRGIIDSFQLRLGTIFVLLPLRYGMVVCYSTYHRHHTVVQHSRVGSSGS